MVIDNGLNVVEIFSNGQNISGNISEFFESITITDNESGESDRMMLVLTDPLGKLAQPDTWQKLTIKINGVHKGVFEVNDISGDIDGSEIEISGTAITTNNNLKSLKSRSFEDITLGGLLDCIAKDNAFSCVIDSDLSDLMIGHVNQVNESDLNLLTRIAKVNDSIFKATTEHLVISKVNGDKDTKGNPLPVVNIVNDGSVTGRWSVKKRTTYGSVTATFIDEDTNIERNVTVGKGAPETRINVGSKNKDEAKAAAKSHLTKSSKLEKEIDLTMPLSEKLTAGIFAQLVGFKLNLDAKKKIKRVTHTVTVNQFDVTTVIL